MTAASVVGGTHPPRQVGDPKPSAVELGGAEQRACLHCGQPVRDPDQSSSGRDEAWFCCGGCQAVYQAIHACGLEAFYRSPETRPQARLSDTSFTHFDAPEFHSVHVKEVDSGERSVELYLEGVHCSACVWLIEKLPSLLPGISMCRLDFGAASLQLRWDPAQVALSEVATQLARFGYLPHPTGGSERRRAQRDRERKLLAKVGVAGAVFGNVMLLSLAMYSGAEIPLLPGASVGDMSATDQSFFRWASMLIGVPGVLWTATPFFRSAAAALSVRTPHMDVPISLGILVALGWGLFGTLTGHGEIYFDSVTMLVFLLLVGRWLQGKHHRAAQETTDLLLALAPSNSRVLRQGAEVLVPTASVLTGETVVLRSGDRVGIDGVVVEGESSIDESLLTGEAMPRRVTRGDPVSSGTTNLGATIRVRATKTGTETRLAQLAKVVARAQTEKAPILQFADRWSAVFLKSVLILAALTFFAWLHLGALTAVERATALLIVTCPCALGLATPLAGSVAIAQAARSGLLIKGLSFLEALNQTGTFVLDKTGTLTSGRLELLQVHGERRYLSYVLALEQHSNHPIAKALRESLDGLVAADAREVRERIGFGLSGTIDGQSVSLGSARFVRDQLSAPDTLLVSSPDGATASAEPKSTTTAEASTKTQVYLIVDGRLTLTLVLGDALRPQARQFVETLKRQGHRVILSSGDRQSVVEGVAATIGGFDAVYYEQSPEDKWQTVRTELARGPVFMVGDGVNDAAALKAATVGIAVHGGAEASIAAADVFATRAGLEPLQALLDGSRRCFRLIRQNLSLSLGYNLVAAGLAVSGLIHPALAAILMPLSSATVVTHSLKSRLFPLSECDGSADATGSSS